jgi:ankyrin repeat protein
MSSVAEEQSKLFEMIIDCTKEININRQHVNFENGQTLLHYAAAHSSSDTILKILHRGGDLMVEDMNNCLPLEKALANKNGKLQFIKKILH